MSTNLPFERQIATWMADEAALGVPSGAIDEALDVTSRLRPRPRWLALLRETPMQTQSRVLVGSPTRRIGLAVALVLAVLAAAAAGAFLLARANNSDDWPAFRGGPARAGVALQGPGGKGVIQGSFKAPVPFSRAIAIVGSVAYASSDDGVLHAIDTETAAALWSFEPPTGGAGSDVAVADGVAYLSDGGSMVYAVDTKTGRERWHAQAPGLSSDITTGDRRLYFGTSDGTLAALDRTTGAEVWRTQLPGATGPVHNPAFDEGRVFVAVEGGSLVAVDGATGNLAWQAPLGSAGSASAVVADHIVYIGPAGDDTVGQLRAFDAASGTLLWSVPEPYSAPAVTNGVAYVTIQPAGDVAAFDTHTGREIWHVKLATSTRAPAVANGVVYVAGDSGKVVYALAADTGLELWNVPVDGGIDCCIAVAGGRVFVGTDAGTLFVIGGDGRPVTPHAIAVASVSPGPAATPTVAPTPSGPPIVAVRWSTVAPTAGWAPNTIAEDPQGNLWVADPYNHQFTIFDADGKFLEAWGAHGTDDGQFNLRRTNGDGYGTVAFADDGSFYVLDVGNYRVQAFDKNRKFVRAWGAFGRKAGQLVDPVGIVVTRDGSIAVLDDARGVIERFDKTGRVLDTFDAFPNAQSGPNMANALATDAAGNFYVSDIEPRQVDRFDSSGKLTMTFGAGRFHEQPGMMAIDPDGRLFVDQGPNRGSDAGIFVFEPDGTYITGFAFNGPGELDLGWPTGLHWVDGDLVVADVKDPEQPQGGARLLRYQLLGPLAP